MKNTQQLTASSLKETLWSTLNNIISGTVSPEQGNAIATQSREILRTVKMQVAIAQMSGRPLSADVIGFSEK